MLGRRSRQARQLFDEQQLGVEAHPSEVAGQFKSEYPVQPGPERCGRDAGLPRYHADADRPEALSHQDLAVELSAALGRTITFHDVDPQTFAGFRVGILPPWQIDGTLKDYRTTAAVKQLQ
jgi:hypothetical protein